MRQDIIDFYNDFFVAQASQTILVKSIFFFHATKMIYETDCFQMRLAVICYLKSLLGWSSNSLGRVAPPFKARSSVKMHFIMKLSAKLGLMDPLLSPKVFYNVEVLNSSGIGNHPIQIFLPRLVSKISII